MTNVQVLSYKKEKGKEQINDYIKVSFSSISSPVSFDSFDVNIILLNDEGIWHSKNDNIYNLDCFNDFNSLKAQINESKQSKAIIVLPQNYPIKYYYSYTHESYCHSSLIKDHLNTLVDNYLTELIPKYLCPHLNLTYGKVKTKIGKLEVDSDFTLNPISEEDSATFSTIGHKTTSQKISDKLIISSVNISPDIELIQGFLEATGVLKNKEDYPEWLTSLEVFDDRLLKEEIYRNEHIIEQSQNVISDCYKRIEANMRYKSILIESGENLVDLVFETLDEILDIDLSQFVDLKKEDFRFTKNGVTFIGEIKGINTNIKTTNITQIDTHYYDYIESEEYGNEKVKQLLIINPMRDKPIFERDKINDKQIEIASRNECLIILTSDLLKLYEEYKKNNITSNMVLNSFLKQSGTFDYNSVTDR